MNKELIQKVINANKPNYPQWDSIKNLFKTSTVKIIRNKNEFDIISSDPIDKNPRVTWYENNKPIGHANLNTELSLDQYVLEVLIDGYKIED